MNNIDEHGLTALHYACAFGKDNAVETLIKYHASGKTNSLCMLLALSYIGYCNAVNVKSSEHETTPLHYACRNGHTGCVKLLIGAKADVDCVDDSGWVPLHFACYW